MWKKIETNEKEEATKNNNIEIDSIQYCATEMNNLFSPYRTFRVHF